MTDFDPYYKWLAIPPAEQPPNYYRLLGVPLFTADADVLENAADQRMSHLRSFQSGKNSQDSQKLLNEVAQARACLLNPQKRAAYDATLRPTAPKAAAPVAAAPVATARVTAAPVSAVRPIPVASPAPPPVAPPTAAPQMQAVSQDQKPFVASHGSSKKYRASKSPVGEIGKHIAGSLAGLALGYVFICWFSASWDRFGLFHELPNLSQIDPHQVPVQVNPAVTPPAIKPVTPKIDKTVVPPKPPEPKPLRPMNTSPMVTPPPVEPELTPEQIAAQKQQQIDKLKDERTAAVEKGDIRNALRLTDELGKLTDIDLLAEKARIIDALNAGERTPAEVTQLATLSMDLATEAVLNNRPEFAAERATAALLMARKSGDQDVVRKATKLVLEVQDKQPSP